MTDNIRNILREAILENPADLKNIVQEELKSRILEAIDEARIDEISKSALGSYIKKSANDIGYIQSDIGMLPMGSLKSDSYKKLSLKRKNRKAGINTAVNKLVKEESDQLEESISNMSHGRLKWHLDTGTPHGRYTNAELKAEKNHRFENGEGETYKQAKSGIHEQADQLDEISSKTLTSYISKSAIDLDNKSYSAGRSKTGQENLRKKSFNRMAGIIDASKKLDKKISDNIKEDLDQLDEAMRIAVGQDVHHCDKSAKFAREYANSEKHGWSNSPTEKHERDNEKFHDTYDSNQIKSGFGGSGITDYTHKTTGEKYRVERVANGRGFHGTDHVVSKLS